MRQMGAAALLPLAVAVACLAALAYGEALGLAIVGARVTSMTASDQAKWGSPRCSSGSFRPSSLSCS